MSLGSGELQKYLQFAKDVAFEAGVVAKRHAANTTLKVVSKGDNSPVSVADEEINALVIERVKQTFPNIGVLGEEQSSRGEATNGLLWVCDPIDGMIPFVLGIPISTFCLALVDDGEPVVGVVYDFSNDRLYFAAKGLGTFCNDEKLVMLAGEPLPIVPVEWWHSAPNDVSELQRKLHVAKYQTPNFASSGFEAMLVARGKLKGLLYAGDKPWDVAASYVIMTELSFRVSDIEGNMQRYDGPIKGAFIGKETLHEELFGDAQI